MKSFAAVMTLVLAMVARPVIADENQGFYLGAGAGLFNLEVDDISDISGDTFKSDDTSLKIFGGWRFNPFISAELAYIDFGGPEDTVGNANFDIQISGFAPYLVGTLPIGFFEVFAKVGYYFYDVELTVRDQTGSASASDSDEDLVYGAGLGIVWFKRLDVRLEYEIIDVSDVDTSDAVWLTGAWRF